jgi:hypothetical protein
MEFLEHALLCLMHETRMAALRRLGGWVERESTEGGVHNGVNATTLPF